MNSTKLSEAISEKFSVFSLLFILVIVLFHSDFRFYFPFIENLTSIAVSYFFMATGFFFYKDLDSNKIILSRLKKRCYTLLLPYVLWNLIYIVLYEISSYSFTDVIKMLIFSPLCIPSWYLIIAFIFLLFSPIIKKALSNYYSTIFLLVFGFIISYLGYVGFIDTLFNVSILGTHLIARLIYLPAYLIGAIAGTFFSKKLSVKCKNCILGLVSSCVFVFLLLWDTPWELQWLVRTFFPLLLWEAIPEKIFCKLKFFKWFTEPAFFINMIHYFFLYALHRFNIRFKPTIGKYTSLADLLLVLISSYVLYYALKFLLPGVLKVLTGNRNKSR